MKFTVSYTWVKQRLDFVPPRSLSGPGLGSAQEGAGGCGGLLSLAATRAGLEWKSGSSGRSLSCRMKAISVHLHFSFGVTFPLEVFWKKVYGFSLLVSGLEK